MSLERYRNGLEPCGKPHLLCFSLPHSTHQLHFGFASGCRLLSLNSVVECGCLQLLYIRMYGKKLISLFQPPDFWRKDVLGRAWVMHLIPGLISCGQRDKVCFGETWQFHRNQIEQWKGLAVSIIEQTFHRCSRHSIKENIHLKYSALIKTISLIFGFVYAGVLF